MLDDVQENQYVPDPKRYKKATKYSERSLTPPPPKFKAQCSFIQHSLNGLYVSHYFKLWVNKYSAQSLSRYLTLLRNWVYLFLGCSVKLHNFLRR
jgi:hypothetical protein